MFPDIAASTLLVVDVQERLLPAIGDRIAENQHLGLVGLGSRTVGEPHRDQRDDDRCNADGEDDREAELGHAGVATQPHERGRARPTDLIVLEIAERDQQRSCRLPDVRHGSFPLRPATASAAHLSARVTNELSLADRRLGVRAPVG